MVAVSKTSHDGAQVRVLRWVVDRATRDVVALSVVLLALTALIFQAIPEAEHALRPSSALALPLVALGFGATLLTYFRIEFRGNAILFSLSEIPLAFALVYLDPRMGLVCRLVASAVVYGLIKRPPIHKLIFNLSSFSLETSVAYLIMRVTITPDPESDLQVVAASTAAVITAGLVGSIAVALAVSRFVDDPLRRILDDLRAAWVLVVNGAMAGTLLSLFMLSPLTAVLATVPVIALWYMMRRHGFLAQQLRDLRAIHGFASRVGRSLDLAEIGESATHEAAQLLRANHAMLLVAGAENTLRSFSTKGFPSIARLPPMELWREVIGDASSLLTSGDALTARGVAGFGDFVHVLILPVEDDIGVIAILVVADSDDSINRFGSDDVDRAQRLADQLAPSIRRSMLHDQIQHEARHDALTGLPNRTTLQRYLRGLDEPAPDDRGRYVMMMDLDRFKEVNDTLGHHAGDELLIEFSRRIARQLGPNDFLARLAGDEFAVVASSRTKAEVTALADQCLMVAAEPVTLDGLSIVVTASIGIAEISPGEPDPETALRHADIAMYDAKSRHNGIEYFRSELDRRTPARLSMLGDLRRALDAGELSVAYQPKLDLTSGLITGAEALARWDHHARGVVPPSDFVRVAEDTGLIKELTDSILAQGIRDLRQLQQLGHHLALSVNLSTHDLLDTNLAARVAGYLSLHDVDPAALTLEITESSLLLEAPRTRSTIEELHELGVHLSIDDFGTGYSSLSYLRRLPVSELKVDQSFIANMLVDQQDEVIVRSTIDLGHNLGLQVVAEGVENEQVLQQLRDIGCDIAQGYAVSRPLNATRFATWLNASHHESRRFDPMEPVTWARSVATQPLPSSRVT